MSTIVNAVGQTEDLLECIIKKRKELINLGMNYGLLDKKTIQCSQYLDELIILHMNSHSGPLSGSLFDDRSGSKCS